MIDPKTVSGMLVPTFKSLHCFGVFANDVDALVFGHHKSAVYTLDFDSTQSVLMLLCYNESTGASEGHQLAETVSSCVPINLQGPPSLSP